MKNIEYVRNQNLDPYIRVLVKISQIHNLQQISTDKTDKYPK